MPEPPGSISIRFTSGDVTVKAVSVGFGGGEVFVLDRPVVLRSGGTLEIACPEQLLVSDG
jgi:hypothetical protein